MPVHDCVWLAKWAALMSALVVAGFAVRLARPLG